MSSQESDKSCKVYNQYVGSNLELFIQKLCTSLHKATEPYNEYFLQVNNLSIASGEVLDLYGKFLNFNRYITFNDPLDVVRPNTEGIEEYLVINARDNDILKQCRLGDKAYRTVLRLLMESKSTMSSVSSLSRIISDIVDADVFIGDNMNMEYITYYFLDRIPGWLEVTMHNYDILPRPAGMSAEYISAFSRFFGFLIKDPYPDPEATAKVFSAFWKARFPTVESKKVVLPYHLLFNTQYNSTPDLSEEERQYIVHTYNKSRTAQEVKLRDAYQATLDLMKKSEDTDKKYMYPPLTRTGIVFPSYTSFLEETDDKTRTSLAWQAKKKALTAFLQNCHFIRQQYLTKEIFDLKKDPRHRLYFDKGTGWYFFKEPNNSGQFDPHYLANIYQDSCGIWYPQDDVYTQLLHGYITLRRDDFASSKVTKTIDTSPLLDKLRPFFLAHKDALTSTLSSDFKRLLNNLHEGGRLLARWLPIHQESFRAIFDMEYDAASLLKLSENIRSKIINNPSGRSTEEIDYFRDLKRRIDNYYGSVETYYYFYRDYDKQSPAYRRRTFIKLQRYHVRKARERLSDLYNDSRAVYNNKINSLSAPNLSSDIYYELDRMRDALQTQYWTKLERYGSYSESYAPINLRNDQVEYYYNDNYNKMSPAKERSAWAYTAAAQCAHLKNRCPDARSERWASFACYTDPNDRRVPKFKVENSGSYDTHGGWYTGYENGRSRGCNVSGYASFSQYERLHNDSKPRWDSEYNSVKSIYEGMSKERKMRTEVTKDRTLRDILSFYDNYDPPRELLDIPWATPQYDVNKEYPFYLETQYIHIMARDEDLARELKEHASKEPQLETYTRKAEEEDASYILKEGEKDPALEVMMPPGMGFTIQPENLPAGRRRLHAPSTQEIFNKWHQLHSEDHNKWLQEREVIIKKYEAME